MANNEKRLQTIKKIDSILDMLHVIKCKLDPYSANDIDNIVIPYFESLKIAVLYIEHSAKIQDKVCKFIAEIDTPYFITCIMMGAGCLYNDVESYLFTNKEILHGYSLLELKQDGTDENGRIIEGSLFEQFLENFSPRERLIHPDTLQYRVDKPDQEIWLLPPASNPDEIISHKVDVTKHGQKRKAPVYIYCDINYNGLFDTGLPLQINIYDKLVHIVSTSLYYAGNKKISARNLFFAMGNSKDVDPNSKRLTALFLSLYKMQRTSLRIDNREESQRYKGYGEFDYSFKYLLPINLNHVKGNYLKNTITNFEVEFIADPPLLQFALDRGQVANIYPSLLSNDNIANTEENLFLQDRFITYIARNKDNKKIKNPKSNFKLKTIYKWLNIDKNDRKKKARTQQKLYHIFENFRIKGFIYRFDITDEKIIYSWNEFAFRKAKNSIKEKIITDIHKELTIRRNKAAARNTNKIS